MGSCEAPMPSSLSQQDPIFVGGTGRSGTSVMADLLNSHPAIVLPVHENKLIVEKGGLRDIVDQLGGRFDMKRHHYAVTDFAHWARKLRNLGFRDPALNEKVRVLRQTRRLGFHAACEVVARENPGTDLSIHAIGHGFDFAHYDRSVTDFILRIRGWKLDSGIVDTEGVIQPFFIPRVMDRSEILRECRLFLNNLYAHPMARAGASRWCDDTPSNWMYFDFLHELYPGMKFIHMIRDPRDVVGSYLKQVWAPSDPKVIVAMLQAQFSDYEDVKRQVPPDRVMEIRIEDIAADKDRILQELSVFLGVENAFDGGLFFNEKVNAGSYADLFNDDVMRMIESELSPWMAKHGYLP